MFLYSAWRTLSLATRIKIATEFGIAKIGPTHVRDNYIESDGYKIEDVERALNVDALQKYTGSDSTDMAVLVEILVEKIVAPIVIAPAIPDTSITVAESMSTPEKIKVVTSPPKKRGRKPKSK